MLRGLSSAGLGALESTEQLIQLAGTYGFDVVDIEAESLIQQYGVDKSRELLTQNGVGIGSIGLPVEWRSTEELFVQGIHKLAKAAEAASTLGCYNCCTYILPSTDMKAAAFMTTAIRRLRICAQILGAYGIRLGLEFVGPHHLRTNWANPFIWTMEETLALIEAIDERNVGLLFDSYHWYTNEMTVADIKSLKSEQIVHVHINDAHNVPVSEALDNGRLYPGEGVIDLAGFLQGLQAIGYQGSVCQEVLTAQAQAESVEELVLRSKRGFDKVFTEAGI